MLYLIYIISKYVILQSIDILSVKLNDSGYYTNVMLKLILLKRSPT